MAGAGRAGALCEVPRRHAAGIAQRSRPARLSPRTRAGLPSVLGLDVAGDFPFEPVAAWAEQHGRKSEIDAALAAGGKEVEHLSALQDQTSIGGVLRDLNSQV